MFNLVILSIMKKIFTLAALAIAISASAATKDKYPTTGKLLYWPVIEGKLPKLPAEPKIPKLPYWPTEPVAYWPGN